MTYLRKTFLFLFILTCILPGFLTVLFFSCEKLEVKRICKIQTGPVSDISYTTAHVDGAIVDVGEGKILQHGHVWARQEYPTINQNKTELT